MAGDRVNNESLHLVLPGNEQAVRETLKQAMAFLRRLDISPEDAGTAELVLAEVVNNVVEHAYAGHDAGVIELCVQTAGDRLAFVVIDDGFPMPEGAAPAGTSHQLSEDLDDLPEGGFGWFLIRELTEGLRYHRDGTRNRLSFEMPLGKTHLPH